MHDLGAGALGCDHFVTLHGNLLYTKILYFSGKKLARQQNKLVEEG